MQLTKPIRHSAILTSTFTLRCICRTAVRLDSRDAENIGERGPSGAGDRSTGERNFRSLLSRLPLEQHQMALVQPRRTGLVDCLEGRE